MLRRTETRAAVSGRQSLPAKAAGFLLTVGLIGAAQYASPSTSIGDEWADCVTSASAEFDLTFNTPGLLRDLSVAEGDIVTAGALLAKTDDAVAAARVAILERRAKSSQQVDAQQLRVELARNRLDRVTRLRRQNIMSSTDLEDAEYEFRLAELALGEAEVQATVLAEELTLARIQLDQTRLWAPANGVVVAVHRRPGEFVSGDQPVLTLATLHPLTARAYLPVARFVDVDTSASVTVEPAPPFDDPVAGRIVSVDRRFDAASRTFGVRIEVENADYGLPAQHRCRVRFGR